MRPDPTAPTTGQRAALAGATLGLLAASSSAMGPLISGSGWWWLCVFVAAVLLAAGVGLRATRLPTSLVPPLQGVVFLLVLTLAFGGTTSILGVIPTAGTFEVFGDLSQGAGVTIQQQTTPAIPVPALLFVLALGIGLLTIAADLAVQVARMPALAAAAALVPVMIPGFIIEDGAQPHTLVATAAAFLVLLRVDVRVRRQSRPLDGAAGADLPTVVAPRRVPVVSTVVSTVGVAAVGLIAAAVLTAATPSISTSLLLGSPTAGALFGRGASPFIDLGRDLRRPAPTPAFRYTASDGDRPYFRLLTLDRFEGETWGPSREDLDSDHSVDEFPRPAGLADDVEVSERQIDVIVDELRTTWLPVPYPSAEVDGLRGSWFWEPSTLAVRSVDTSTLGQHYRVVRLDIDPTADQLRDAAPVFGRFADELALPEERPTVIRDTALAVTAGASSAYDQAVAIQDWLRGGEFSYSTEAPVEAGYDGGGLDVIAAFLEAKAGYCVHFASTMAVFARELGIPARIAVGYTAGTATDERIEGRTVLQVDSHDLHAWPELYFDGVGWVPFEPTPGRGVVPAYTRSSTTATGPFPSSSAGAPGAASGRPDLDPDRGLGLNGGATATTASDAALRIAIAVLAIAVVLLPMLIRRQQAWSRRRGIRRGREPATAAWAEFVATARDLGVPAPAGVTPRAFAAALAARPAFADDAGGEAGGALSVLRDAVEHERYGRRAADGMPRAGHGPDELTAALDEVRRALAADSRAVDRIRAAVLPASLLGGFTARAGSRPADGA
ncbi:transglutaminaseTgpA domain-containing protein [Agromyces sp. MMS24-K17]|uniref:transglutaminaseTgpA domain-containing protein n=1 Tax=Agromyces sp. MMS24-K17 TaxID=3372850 RepID=UPI0037550C32